MTDYTVAMLPYIPCIYKGVIGRDPVHVTLIRFRIYGQIL